MSQQADQKFRAALIVMGAKDYADALVAAAIRFKIEFDLERAHFIAQMSVESAGFKRVRENLNYSVKGLLALFSRSRISEADVRKFGRIDGVQKADQQALANILYGGAFGAKNLGNTQPGDGWRFIGRGLKQVTGRGNYAECSRALFGDERLLDAPELLEQIPHCADSAAWFWQARGVGELARKDDLIAVTKRVNGGTNGLDDRRIALGKAKKLMGVK